MSLFIFVRHGQSVWNLENRFTGEVDVELTPLGEEEAKHAGELLKPYTFQVAYTSLLSRAIHTLNIILKEINNTTITTVKTAALNERNYGDLQGLNKSEIEQKYGKEQVLLWRRSYEAVPPGGESLEDTYKRVVPFYKNEIVPELSTGKNILLVAHGNSLRALMMFLENIGTEQIAAMNIATGMPKLYEFDASLKLIKTHYLT